MFKSGKTLKNAEGKEFKTTLLFTKEAMFGCEDGSIIPEVAADSFRDAAVYVTNHKEGDRVTVVTPLLKMVVTGIVVYKDDNAKEMEIFVTNVYSDIFVITKLNSDYATID